MVRETPPAVPSDPKGGGRKIAVLSGLGLIMTLLAVLWSAATPLTDPVWFGVDMVRGWIPAPVSALADAMRQPGTLEDDLQAARRAVPGGDAGRGADLIVGNGCGACHVIPGIAGARGSVGPGLDGFADRAYMAGSLQTAPRPLVAWLIDPPAIDPETAMPDLGLTEPEARDVAAYLMTLVDS